MTDTVQQCSDLTVDQLPERNTICLGGGDVDSGGIAQGLTCEDVGYEGCCQGTKLVYCESSEMNEIECEQECGVWVFSGYYACTTFGGQSPEPTGTYPIDCPLQ